MGVVSVLPRSVSELIAAGEVVERPASVVKELIENSIDAGASKITVEIKNGGTTFIRVADDGCGMDREDAKTCFLRHATSKLKTADDLYNIHTMGFRGEALAATAAQAKVELFTRRKEDVEGTRVVIEGGELKSCAAAGCPAGTTVVVRDLFYNTPARKKFLKKEITESAAVSAAVDRAALGSPDVAVTFIKDGRQARISFGKGLADAAANILGREAASRMIEVKYDGGGVAVGGLVGIPEAARPNRSMQYFFLNGRYVKGRIFSLALEEAMKNSVMTEKYPICVLKLEISPDKVDVNVHPTKTEVKFSNEKEIYDAVYLAVKGALLADSRRPDFRSGVRAAARIVPAAPPESKAGIQTFFGMLRQPAASPAGTVEIDPAVLPKTEGEGAAGAEAQAAREYAVWGDRRGGQTEARRGSAPQAGRDEEPAQDPVAGLCAGGSADVSGQGVLKTGEETEQAGSAEAQRERETGSAPEESAEAGRAENGAQPSDFRIAGVLFGVYVLVEYGDEFVIIDKHAAQERIRFEDLRNAKRKTVPQFLLSPVGVELSRNEYVAVVQNLDRLSQLGFEIESFGGSTVAVRAVPMDLFEYDARDMLIEIAEKLEKNKREITPDVYDEILHSIACKASVKAGDRSAKADLEELVNQVLTRNEIRNCPHGRPVALSMSKAEFDRRFGRI